MPDLRQQLESTLGATYALERELGAGGMSRVFLAEERSLGRQVVIKVLPPEMGGALSAERFRREIQLAARLQHPLVVPLLSAGEAGELLYYTMPYIKGESLRARLAREGELPVNDAVKLLRDVLEALAAAHAHGIVHRDIKPDNILISAGHALVTDFGVAKAVSAAVTMPGSVTATSVVVGTPLYMAPEQAAGDPSVDHRADLYAFGAVAYEMLTGRAPFGSLPPQRVLAAQVTEAPDVITRHRPSLPPELAALVMCCLEKRPADRPQSADDVLRELEVVTSGAGVAPAGKPRPMTRRAGGAPAGRRVGIVAGVALALALVAYFTASLLTGGRVPRVPGRGQSVGASANVTKSVAVLPFANLSADAENEYFSDGVTEELVTALGKVDGLRVLSALSLKGPARDAPDIGRRLGVETVLSGSVRRAGDRLRISARLTSASDGFQLWAETYEREMKDVFAVQDEIARAIVGALRVRFTANGGAPLVARQTEDLTAYDLYLRGRYFWNRRTDDAMSRAVRYFEQAIARDPTYALAYAGLGDAYVIPFGGPSKERLPKARAAALKALTLDSTLAEAHATLGQVSHNLDWDWATAEREFRSAFALKPDYATARHWNGLNLLGLGKTDEALAEIRRAQQLDPISPAIASDLGWALICAHRYDEAIEQFEKVLELDPSYVRAHGRLAAAHLHQGDVDEAIAEFRRAIELAGGWLPQPWGLPGLGYAYAVSGRRAEALHVLRDLQVATSGRYVRLEALAIVHTGLGNTDEALRWLERAVEERSFPPEWMRDPLFDRLRSDRRFIRLMRRAGLER